MNLTSRHCTGASGVPLKVWSMTWKTLGSAEIAK